MFRMIQKMTLWQLAAFVVAAVVVILMCNANGNQQTDSYFAEKDRAHDQKVTELLKREAVEFTIVEGRGEIDVITRAGFPHRENIKQEVLLDTFWKLNGKKYPDHFLHPGDIVRMVKATPTKQAEKLARAD